MNTTTTTETKKKENIMNTKMKHTPGKWTTKIRQPGTMLTVENENGEYVCSLLGGDEHKQENARLIAAAPLMMEALRELLREAWAADKIYGEAYGESLASYKTWEKARAALAQAAGGAQ